VKAFRLAPPAKPAKRFAARECAALRLSTREEYDSFAAIIDAGCGRLYIPIDLSPNPSPQLLGELIPVCPNRIR
jgi:hypothetical protein